MNARSLLTAVHLIPETKVQVCDFSNEARLNVPIKWSGFRCWEAIWLTTIAPKAGFQPPDEVFSFSLFLLFRLDERQSLHVTVHEVHSGRFDWRLREEGFWRWEIRKFHKLDMIHYLSSQSRRISYLALERCLILGKNISFMNGVWGVWANSNSLVSWLVLYPWEKK